MRPSEEWRVPMTGRPVAGEAAPYYFKYIDRVGAGDIVGVLDAQRAEATSLLEPITEDRSLFRYAPEKWSIRRVLNHVNDTERLFVFRAFWFARGFDSALPAFDQDAGSAAAGADGVSWARHVEEFRAIRAATVSFFGNLPAEAWTRRGIASDNPVSVRALAYITAGHLQHHMAVLRERYAAASPSDELSGDTESPR